MTFLKRVEGTVCDQLKRNIESHAFDGSSNNTCSLNAYCNNIHVQYSCIKINKYKCTCTYTCINGNIQ